MVRRENGQFLGTGSFEYGVDDIDDVVEHHGGPNTSAALPQPRQDHTDESGQCHRDPVDVNRVQRFHVHPVQCREQGDDGDSSPTEGSTP